MGLMFWLWMGFWLLGWIVLLTIFFVVRSREAREREAGANRG